MEITDVKIRRIFETAPLKAVASVTFDGQFAVHDIKVISTQEKLFIVMPSRKNPDGTYRDIAHPHQHDFPPPVGKHRTARIRNRRGGTERSGREPSLHTGH